MAAVAAHRRHVEEVVGLRRVGGGLDRGQARAADRPRRQTRVDARVVRVRVLQLGHPQGARPLVHHEARGGVDVEPDAVVQAVVDHRGDQLALLGHLHLALDQRGDDQHVVAGQVLAACVAHVDLAEVALERVQLLADEPAHARALLELVRGREQEALEARRPLGPVVARIEVGVAPGRLDVVAGQRLHERSDLAPRATLRDRDPDHVRRQPLLEAVEHGRVLHVAGERVRAGLELLAAARQPGSQLEEGRARHDALLLQQVGDVAQARTLRDHHRHAALAVAGERLEQADQEAARGEHHDQQGADREQAPPARVAPPRRPGAVRGRWRRRGREPLRLGQPVARLGGRRRGRRRRCRPRVAGATRGPLAARGLALLRRSPARHRRRPVGHVRGPAVEVEPCAPGRAGAPRAR